MRRTGMVILTALLLCLPGIATAQVLPEGFARVAVQGGFTLYAQEQTGCFYVEQSLTGFTWWSNPPDRANDPVAKGMQLMDLSSPLLFRLFDIPVRNETLANAFTSSINKGGAVFTLIENGFRMEYSLPDFQIMVPMEVTLHDGYVDVSIPIGQITEGDPKTIVGGISVLPYFHAGGSNESGYMLVPDGSGALIYFNNRKQTLGEYRQPVYGKDLTYNRMFQGNVEQTAALPVYGVSKEKSGYLAVIMSSAAHATLNARVSGAKTSYNTVFSEISLRTSDTYEIGQQNQIRIFDETPPRMDSCQVRFYLLSEGGCDYNAMAKTYRKHLTQVDGVSCVTYRPELVLELYGAVQKKQLFLGFARMAQTPLTTFENAREMINQVLNGGVKDVAVQYQRMTDDALSGVYEESFTPLKILGGQTAFEELRIYCEEKNVLLAPAVDSLYFAKDTLSVNSFFNAARTLPKQVSTQFVYRLASTRINFDRTPSYLLSPSLVPDKMVGLTRSLLQKKLSGITLKTLGSVLYSDFGGAGSGRDQSQASFVGAAQAIAKNIPSIVMTSPNAYMLSATFMATDIPSAHSLYDLCDVAVPFYQMVLSGLLPYTTTSVNLDANPEQMVLSALENGSILKYTLLHENASVLIGTDLDWLHGTSKDAWLSDALRQVLIVNEVRGKTQGGIVEHNLITPLVRKTTYQNGTVIYVNYATEAYLLPEGDMVPAKGYLVVERGQGR